MSGIASTCPVEGGLDLARPLGPALEAGRVGMALPGWIFSGLLGALGALGLGDASAIDDVEDTCNANASNKRALYSGRYQEVP